MDMKRLLSLILVSCLLLCSVAFADEAAEAPAEAVEVVLPEVAIELDESISLVSEQEESEFSLKLYMVDEAMLLYQMSMPAEIGAADMSATMLGELPADASVTVDDDGAHQRVMYLIDDAEYPTYVDVFTVWENGCTVCLMAMADGSVYDQIALSDQMNAWLATMTVNGNAVVQADEAAE